MADYIGDKVYKYATNGTYLSRFDLHRDNTDPRGIAYDGTDFWVPDSSGRVYAYSTTGAYQSRFNLSIVNGNPYGIAIGKGSYWVGDTGSDKVYKYSTNRQSWWDYQSTVELHSDNNTLRGVAYHDDSLWGVDIVEDKVYWYLAMGTKEFGVLIPDVSVSDSLVLPGQSSTLSVRVSNSGPGDVGPTTLTYYRSTDSIIGTLDTPLGTSPLPSLNEGDFSAHSSSITSPINSRDSYYYGACVSVAAGETSTTNNCSAGVRVRHNRNLNLTSDNRKPYGITYHDNAFWVVDTYDEKVYKYTTSGAYLSRFDLREANEDPIGLTYADNAFWVADYIGNKVYKYATNGAYLSRFDLHHDNTQPRGIAYDGIDFWVPDGDGKVYSYSTAGAYQSNFNLSRANGNPYGIAIGKGSYWVGDSGSDTVYEYSTNRQSWWENQSTVDLTNDNTTPRGVAYHDDALWVVDRDDNKVYWYAAVGTKRPDLLCDVSVSDSRVLPGQSSTLLVRVSNSGLGDSGTTTLTYYRSTESIIGTLDTPLNTTQVPSLNAGDFSAHSISITSPINSRDSYYYGACVSTVSGEVSIANNCSAGVLVRHNHNFNLTSDNGNPHGITYHDNAFWVVDSANDEVYKYSTNGAYLFNFNLHSDNIYPRGLAYADNAFWVVDTGDDKVYKYSTNGAYQSRFNLNSYNDDPRGIAYDGTYLWVANGNGRVYSYSTLGAYQSRFNLSSDNNSPKGIAVGKGSYWVVDSGSDTVHEYSTNRQSWWEHQSTVYLTNDNTTPRGVAYHDDALWVVDFDNEVYWYAAVGTKKPRLLIPDVSVSDSRVLPGQSFTLSVRVSNSGPGDAGPTTLTYYRSINSYISTNDTSLGTDDVPSLNAGDFSAHSISITFPSPNSRDSYYYGACVSTVSGEVSIANNCSAGVRVKTNHDFNLTSDNGNPHGITYHDNAFWVVDSSNDNDNKVYKYSTNGAYLSNFNLHNNNIYPRGIAYGDNAFWVVDTDDKVYKYSTNGAYLSSFNLISDNKDPRGIAYDGTDLWVSDKGGKVYSYSTTTGVYLTSFNLTSDNGNPLGITVGKGAYWVGDTGDDRVYEYVTNRKSWWVDDYQSRFDLSSDNTYPRGVAYYDDALWVVDRNNKVYWYPFD